MLPVVVTLTAVLLVVVGWLLLDKPSDRDAAGSAGRDSSRYWTDVDPGELAALIEREQIALVNVHVPYEGELPGTDLFIAYDEVDRHRDRLPADQDAPLVLYCRTGRMSQEAARTVVDLGYTSVTS